MHRLCYRPKAVVEYQRRAFIAKENQIRITLDSQERKIKPAMTEATASRVMIVSSGKSLDEPNISKSSCLMGIPRVNDERVEAVIFQFFSRKAVLRVKNTTDTSVEFPVSAVPRCQ